MTSQAKPSSRWGSFFQQAVAGVESRLDTILAEDEGPPTPSRGSAGSVEQREGSLRLPGTSRNLDRLQERLAKAVGGKTQPASASNSVATTPRTASPIQNSASPRSSLDSRGPTQEANVTEKAVQADPTGNDATSQDLNHTREINVDSDQSSGEPKLFVPAESRQEVSRENSAAGPPANLQYSALEMSEPTSMAEYRQLVEQLRRDHEAAEQERRSETNHYLEHIDSLQAKLQYLSHEAVIEAKKVNEASETGDVRRQLTQRDERIALLIGEGTKWSQNEMKLMNTIKKLRLKTVEDEKSLARTKRAEADMRTGLVSLKEQLELLGEAGRENARRAESLDSVQAELERVSQLVTKRDSQILELKQRIDQSESRDDKGGVEGWKHKLALEQEAVLTLREELSGSKIERDLLADRHKLQQRDLQAKLDREVESRRAIEIDLKGELQVMESRLETYRAQAEAISSEGGNDVQAKLTRQIETLQNSYSVASENWRGIEGSLLARIAGFEKEQGEMQKRESELRRKSRETSNRCKELEVRLGNETSKTQELEERLSQERQNVSMQKNSLAMVTEELNVARSQLQSTKESFETRIERLETERRESLQDWGSLRSVSNSPVPKANLESTAVQSRRLAGSPSLGVGNTIGPFVERPSSRRTSTQPLGGFLIHRQDSTLALSQASTKENGPGTSKAMSESQEELFEGVATPATPERTINDMLSTSTAAGPSVQLVERMSAAVRRLESEKAASKDEVDRLSTQRDEARNQVINLMHELEGKRAGENEIAAMEIQVQELNVRLQTTLEMLGEKSELVEELKADIVDMKEIYRATLENTVK